MLLHLKRSTGRTSMRPGYKGVYSLMVWPCKQYALYYSQNIHLVEYPRILPLKQLYIVEFSLPL